MRSIRTLFLAALVAGTLLAARNAAACTIAPEHFSGYWWYEYRQTPDSTPVVCGSQSNICLHTAVYDQTCNSLQSRGSITGSIKWFGNTGAGYTIGSGPYAGDISLWLYPPESGTFYWYDPTAVRWNRLYNCRNVGGSSDWACTHQQSDQGINWSGTAVVTLHRIF